MLMIFLLHTWSPILALPLMTVFLKWEDLIMMMSWAYGLII